MSISFRSAFFILLLSAFSLYAESSNQKTIYGFKNAEGTKLIKMVLVGETMSIEKASTIEIDLKKDDSLLEVDTRPDTVTAKIVNNPGIRVGQTLYLIEKNPDHDSFRDGNIVGQFRVVSIFNTGFFGQQLRGEGYLRLIDGKVMTVAMPIESVSLTEAVMAKKQGDYFLHKSDTAAAIQYYKKAVKMDKSFPEAHYALALLHERKGEGFVTAKYEYNIAWQNRHKFMEQSEKFRFLLSYASFYMNYYKKETVRNNPKETEDLNNALAACKEAYQIAPSDTDLLKKYSELYLILYLHSKEVIPAEPELKKVKRAAADEYDEKAVSFMEKALKASPEDAKQYALAVYLYYEKLRSLDNPNSPVQASQKKEFKEKIETYGKLYLTYRPKSQKLDRNVTAAMKFARSL